MEFGPKVTYVPWSEWYSIMVRIGRLGPGIFMKIGESMDSIYEAVDPDTLASYVRKVIDKSGTVGYEGDEIRGAAEVIGNNPFQVLRPEEVANLRFRGEAYAPI